MEVWMYWIVWALMLLILELFVWTFDALALAISASVTALLSYLLDFTIHDWWISWLIFVVATIVALLITRLLVLPRITWHTPKNPLSIDNILWTTGYVVFVKDTPYIRISWNLHKIISSTPLVDGQKVYVIWQDEHILVVQ